MTRTKKQHFVPQFYLRAFSDGAAARLWCYDKVLDKCWRGNVKDVAQEHDFNEYSATSDASNRETYQMIEKGLAEVESKAAAKISALIGRGMSTGTDGPAIVTPALKRDLGCFMALQMLRTKEARVRTREMITKVRGKVREAVQELRPALQFAETNYEPSEDYLRYQHLATMFQEAIELTSVFENKTWTFCVTDSGNLWTSDHPVIFDALQPPWEKCQEEIDSPNVVVMFPLSPKLIVRLYERERCGAEADGKVYSMRDDAVKRANQFQLGQCYRQIYSSADDLQLAQSLAKWQPGFCNTERDRVDLRDVDATSILSTAISGRVQENQEKVSD